MVSASTIRSEIASSLAALSGWTESRWSPGLFGADSDHLMHHAFAVSISETRVHAKEGRQRLSQGALAETYVDVFWAHRIVGDAQVSAYAAALDAEEDAYRAILGSDTSAGWHVLLDSLRRDDGGEGWVLGTIRVRCIHQIALS